MTTSRARTERRHQDQKRRKALRKFMNGDITPNDFYRRHGFPPSAKCAGCAGPPAIKATVLVEHKEAVKRGMVPAMGLDPAVNEAVAKTIVDLRGPSGPVPHFRATITYACSLCRVKMERALARSPSWTIVEINEGPDPRNRVTVGYAS